VERREGKRKERKGGVALAPRKNSHASIYSEIGLYLAWDHRGFWSMIRAALLCGTLKFLDGAGRSATAGQRCS